MFLCSIIIPLDEEKYNLSSVFNVKVSKAFVLTVYTNYIYSSIFLLGSYHSHRILELSFCIFLISRDAL